MATPHRLYGGSGGGNLSAGTHHNLYGESTTLRHSTSSSSASRNPFRTSGGGSNRAGSSMAAGGSSATRGVLRENTPSFADCFSGMETHYFNLGESPGAQSPTPMRRSGLSRNPAVPHSGGKTSQQQLNTNVPTSHHLSALDQSAVVAGAGGGGEADFSYNSLQLSTENGSQLNTPPPRLEREEYYQQGGGGGGFGSAATAGMFASHQHHHPQPQQQQQQGPSTATPNRPPLHPNVSPIGVLSPVPGTTTPIGPRASVADAVAAGYVSPGHGRGAAHAQNEYESEQRRRQALGSTPMSTGDEKKRIIMSEGDSNRKVSSATAGVFKSEAHDESPQNEHTTENDAHHPGTGLDPEVTQENFQRSMREAEEEAALQRRRGAGSGRTSPAAEVTSQQQEHGKGGAMVVGHGEARGGSAATSQQSHHPPSSTAFGTIYAPSTEPVPQDPGFGGTRVGGGGASVASSQLSLEKFLGHSTPEQRDALIVLLQELNKPAQGGGGTILVKERISQLSSEQLAHLLSIPAPQVPQQAWQLPNSDDIGSPVPAPSTSHRHSSLAAFFLKEDPLSKIAPDFGYYEPNPSSTAAFSALSSPSSSYSALPSKWRRDYESALYKYSPSAFARGGSGTEALFERSSPFGTSRSPLRAPRL